MPKLYYIATMGCQMNDYTSDYLGQLFLNEGFKSTDDIDHADIIMINTCTVRGKAQQKAFSFLGRMEPLKKRNPHLIIGIMGCVAQQEGSNLLKRFHSLDLVLGTREISRVCDFIKQIEKDREKIVAVNITKIPSIEATMRIISKAGLRLPSQ